MKLNETKEKVPTTFLTSYISDAWDKIGYINADIEAIKKEYSNTKGVIDGLQDLVDAYLITIGRFQAILDGKDFSIPTEEELKTKAVDRSAEKEKANSKKIEESIISPEVKPIPVAKSNAIVRPAVEQKINNVDIRLPKDNLDAPVGIDFKYDSGATETDNESFMTFPDFPEPDLNTNPVELDPSIFGNMMKK